MKAKDAMFVWTPARSVFSNYPTKGAVDVTQIPEAPELKVHPKSAGACDYKWKNTDEGGRLEQMQKMITAMITEDLVSVDSLVAALQKVDEFENYPFDFS